MQQYGRQDDAGEKQLQGDRFMAGKTGARQASARKAAF
jgi:hypothetical protein